MMEQIILSILASASVSAALFATLVWLSKSWLSERIRGAISHEYSVKLEAYKATLRTEFDKEIVTLKARLTLESDKETEILKASLKSDVDVAVEQMRSRLQMTAYEHQIRFQKLHERVADTIVETYAKLKRLHVAVVAYTDPPQSDSEAEPVRRKAVVDALEAFREYYRPRKIFIPRPTAELIDNFESKLFQVAQDFMWSAANEEDPKCENRDRLTKVSKDMSEDVPRLFEQLEQDFQNLLGVPGRSVE